MSPSSSDGIFHSIFVRFYLKNTSPNFEKSLKLYWKNRHFWHSSCFSIRYLQNAILVPTWLHVGANMGSCWLKKRSWHVLGRFGGLLGRPPQHCKRIGFKGVLRRFKGSSRPLGGRVFLHVTVTKDFGGVPHIPSEASWQRSNAFRS